MSFASQSKCPQRPPLFKLCQKKFPRGDGGRLYRHPGGIQGHEPVLEEQGDDTTGKPARAFPTLARVAGTEILGDLDGRGTQPLPCSPSPI